MAMLAMLAMLVFAPAAGAQQGPSCPVNQVNVLLESGEFICVPEGAAEQTPEQLEAVTNDPRGNAETPIIERPRNCDEFGGSQASAQQFLENVTPNDEFNLDPDNDGLACEELLDGGGVAPAPAAPAPAPTTGSGVTVMPDTGGPALLLPVAALLVGSGLLGFAALRRRS